MASFDEITAIDKTQESEWSWRAAETFFPYVSCKICKICFLMFPCTSALLTQPGNAGKVDVSQAWYSKKKN